MAYLVLLLAETSEDGERIYRLEDGEVYLGRSSHVDIQIHDINVSRKHAKIVHQEGGTFVLYDLNTKNGTFVNGVAIKRHVLREGDIISLGRSQLIFTRDRWVSSFGFSPRLPSSPAEDMPPISGTMPTAMLSIESLAAQLAGVTHKLSLIYWMSRIIQEESDTELFLQKSLICFVEGLHAQRGVLYLYYPKEGLIPKKDIFLREFSPHPSGRTVVLKAYSQGQPILEYLKWEGEEHTVLAHPLQLQGKVLGVLQLENVGHTTYSDAEYHFLRVGTNIFSTILENRQLIHHLQRARKEIHDHLTLCGILTATIAELRNPLTSALGFAQLLEHQEQHQDEGRSRKLLRIQQQLDRACYLLEQLASLIPSQEMALHIEDFNLFLRRAVEKYRTPSKDTAASPKVEWILDLSDSPLPISMDAPVLERAIFCLFRNAEEAIEDASEGYGKIHLRSWRDGDWVYCSIRDTGSGISSEEVLEVFRPFSTTKRGKQGVGLTFAKSIIELHGGKIRIQPPIGSNATARGTEVLLKFPYRGSRHDIAR